MAASSRAERQRRDGLCEIGLKEITRQCGEPKPLSAFGEQSDGYRGLRGGCRDCKNMQAADHRQRTPDYQAHRQRRWRHANRKAWPEISRRRDVRVGWRREGTVTL
ncbi:MAG: hypothetical protein ACLP3C_31175 [Mycobacterium sp.]|uniref:hypothetical protein n=1 Tax=Mycobacterium sp. TaxID=1785 RepID=UPI003F9B06A6